MARIDIHNPTPFIFRTSIDVRVTDINYGNHVGHDAFISILHEARVRFFSHLGYEETDIDGKSIVISDLAVTYKSQSFYGDTLEIQIAVADFNKHGCDIYYKATCLNTDTLVLKAKTGIVFLDAKTNQVAHTPQAFIKKLT